MTILDVYKRQEDTELLEDVIIENTQAIEMANIYSGILRSMMDAFASVISNNLNDVMKILSVITIVMSIPTIIFSAYGMNLSAAGMPFSKTPWGFLIVILISIALSAVSYTHLSKTALSHVEAGADMVAPSDMMDGRVRAIRECLDKAGHKETPIMSYAVKYASAFYGPFRDAAGSAPAFGDRKSYQMDYHNRREGMKEALTDIEEGADIIMIKPAMSYLDMVSEVHKATNVPIAAYSVSGEYAMVKAAAKMGWIEEDKIVCEMAASAYRAGVQIYLTYYAKELAGFIQEGRIG